MKSNLYSRIDPFFFLGRLLCQTPRRTVIQQPSPAGVWPLIRSPEGQSFLATWRHGGPRLKCHVLTWSDMSTQAEKTLLRGGAIATTKKEVKWRLPRAAVLIYRRPWSCWLLTLLPFHILAGRLATVAAPMRGSFWSIPEVYMKVVDLAPKGSWRLSVMKRDTSVLFVSENLVNVSVRRRMQRRQVWTNCKACGWNARSSPPLSSSLLPPPVRALSKFLSNISMFQFWKISHEYNLGVDGVLLKRRAAANTQKRVLLKYIAWNSCK